MKSQKIDSISKSDSEPTRKIKISTKNKTTKCLFDYKKAFSDIAFTDFSRSAKYKPTDSSESSNPHALSSLSSYSSSFDETTEEANQYKSMRSLSKKSVKKYVGSTNRYSQKTLMGNWFEERILENERNLLRFNNLQIHGINEPSSAVDIEEQSDQFFYNQSIFKLVNK